MEIASIVFLITGLAVGFAIGWLLRANKSESSDLDQSQSIGLERTNAVLTSKVEEYQARLLKAEETFANQKNEILQSERLLSASQVENKNLLEKLETQKEELMKIHEKFEKEFENLATKILKANTEDFAENNSKRLGQILDPLKEKIVTFEKQVQEKYIDETKERSKLLEKIDELTKLNQTIGLEASNLTNALKGDNKTQGNWGELILERILEDSGLTKDREYSLQYSMENAEGSRIQPDVIVNLPDKKHIIIDSKVSLTAYQEYANSEDADKRDAALKAHVLSMRNHIKMLSDKNYSSGKTVNSPDFVLLFVNIESGFSAAWKADNDLYSYASKRKIYIVSPSTLLAALRTISSVWKHERQTQNAIEIARQSGMLYDKFVGFVEDLLKIKKGIDTSNDAYDSALNKLKLGSGNLVGRAEKLRKLGAKTSKKLSRELTETDEDEQEQEQLIEDGTKE